MTIDEASDIIFSSQGRPFVIAPNAFPSFKRSATLISQGREKDLPPIERI